MFVYNTVVGFFYSDDDEAFNGNRGTVGGSKRLRPDAWSLAAVVGAVPSRRNIKTSQRRWPNPHSAFETQNFTKNKTSG